MAVDIQGHGDSDHGERFLGWNRNAELAMQAFQAHAHLYSEVPHFALGHSFGGVLTALLLADRQHTFRKALLLDPVLFSQPMLMGMSVVSLVGAGRLTPLAKAAMRRRQHWPDRKAAFEGLHGRGTYKGWSDDALRAFVNHALRDAPDGGVELKCAPLARPTSSVRHPSVSGSVGRIRIPTLILHAQDSMPFVGPVGRAGCRDQSVHRSQTSHRWPLLHAGRPRPHGCAGA